MKNRTLFGCILWILLCFLLLTCLSACNAGSGTADETTSGTAESEAGSTEAEETVDQNIRLVENNTVLFRIVRPDESTEGEFTAANELRAFFESFTGNSASVTVETDLLRFGETHDKETLEILIGRTNYDETAEVLKNTGYGEYSVAAVGNKIVIAGWEGDATLHAATTFGLLLQEIGNASADGNLILPRGSIGYTQVSNEKLSDLPVAESGALKAIYDCGTDTYEVIVDDVAEGEFDAYLAKLASEGYEKYSENARGTVRFATYVGNKRIVNVYAQEYYHDLRVIVEDYDEKILPPKESAYQKVCDTEFAQVGLEYNKNQIGHCFIWKLEDGRFIVVDGGYTASIVYNALSAMAEDPNEIVIATWIISHFHPDHNNAFKEFGGKYGNMVTLQSVLWNSPSEEQYNHEMNPGDSSCYTEQYQKVLSSLRKFSGSPIVYQAHPGQIYHFANARIDILYTLEMYAPANIGKKDLNTTCLVFDVSFGDFNMMITNDMTEKSNKIMRNNYGKTLVSEVGQVAHHGYAGGTFGFYQLVDPIYGLFTTGLVHYEECKSADRNRYFLGGTGRLEEVYIAGDDVFLFKVEKDVGFSDMKQYNNVTDFKNGVEKSA